MVSKLNGFLEYFSGNEIQPAYAPELARENAVGIAPSQTIAAGTVLGEVGNVNAVYTITIGAGTSGGHFTLTTTAPIAEGPTGNIAWNATNATLLASLQSALNTTFGTTGGTANVLAAAGTLAAGIGTILLTFQNALGGQPVTMTLADSTTGGAGTTIASTTTGVAPTGTYKAYSSTNSDGSQASKCISKYDLVTDASGNITFGLQSGGGEFSQTELTAPVWIAGFFNTIDLTGYDGTLGSLVSGSPTNGVVHIH